MFSFIKNKGECNKMTRAVVTVGFVIYDKKNKKVFINEGDRINYERYDDTRTSSY